MGASPVIAREEYNILSMLMDEVKRRAAAPLDEHFHVELNRAEMALIIGALLQAEVTLPLIDKRYAAMKCLGGLRTQQLSLANRLEDMMAEIHPPCPVVGVCPQSWQDLAECSPTLDAKP